MKQVLEALRKILPEDQVKDLEPAVEATVEEMKQELESEFNKNLEEAYAKLADELKENEEVGVAGYQEAYTIINDLYGRLDTQQAEFEKVMDEGYEEAYQMLVSERSKNEKLEVEIYEEYDKKLAEMREYFVDKIDEFLQYKGQQMYEQARREVTNDPQMAEHKVAMDKVVDILSNYISNEDYSADATRKLEDAVKEVDDIRGKSRILEARNMRLSTENKKLNESVRSHKDQADVINESKKERAQAAKKATGRGQTVTENVKVIGEHDEDANQGSTDVLTENVDTDELAAMRRLAGIKSTK